MAFFLRKFIEALLLPLGMGGLLVLVGLLLRRRTLAFLGVIVIWVAAAPITAGLLMKPLEGFYAQRTIEETPHADAIVMLAGGIIRGVSKSGIQWGEASNRFFAAVNLQLAGKASFLILTDGAPVDGDSPGDHVIAHGNMLRAEAILRGVPEDRILLTGRVFTTEDEARAVAALPGIHDILLVTSAFHLPRAAMLFSAFGFHVTPFPTDERNFPHKEDSLQKYMPLADGYRETEAALREYYGLAVYRILLTVRPPAQRAVSATAPAAGSVPR